MRNHPSYLRRGIPLAKFTDPPTEPSALIHFAGGTIDATKFAIQECIIRHYRHQNHDFKGVFMKWIRSVMLVAAGVVLGSVVTYSVAAQQNRPLGHRINHVGISVTNFDESLKFYTQVMGFKEAYRFPSQNGQPSTTFLQVNRDTFIEMAPANGRPAGLTHIGLYYDDAQASVTQFRQAGAIVGDVRPSENSGSRLSNVTDPNSIRIEINEQPDGSLMRKAMNAWK